MEWLSPMLEVDIGEALGLLTTMQLVRELQLQNMDFEADSKIVVDNIYGKRNGISDFGAIIGKCRQLPITFYVMKII